MLLKYEVKVSCKVEHVMRWSKYEIFSKYDEDMSLPLSSLEADPSFYQIENLHGEGF